MPNEPRNIYTKRDLVGVRTERQHLTSALCVYQAVASERLFRVPARNQGERWQEVATKTVTLQPHQERVVNEKAELDTKIEKLDAFRHGDIYPTLPIAERDRLTRQYVHMKDYSNVLGERIAAF